VKSPVSHRLIRTPGEGQLPDLTVSCCARVLFFCKCFVLFHAIIGMRLYFKWLLYSQSVPVLRSCTRLLPIAAQGLDKITPAASRADFGTRYQTRVAEPTPAPVSDVVHSPPTTRSPHRRRRGGGGMPASRGSSHADAQAASAPTKDGTLPTMSYGFCWIRKGHILDPHASLLDLFDNIVLATAVFFLLMRFQDLQCIRNLNTRHPTL
jgi:hypothetical protein